ncbi:STAS domain-containing protein [Mycobacterium vicinigordonae]|uniref:STAS domain-containing protein n=1 Tax=Mycobacterium vicinigordonae TaxID=1719132 RepID=A0A7D6E7F9_9MYCO|nr:STAS domain-containing protein [Mycobacterium vicinigordonae]QLL08523.1 STAS domain-containing protein [Mycobacterium vicinigordonae]
MPVTQMWLKCPNAEFTAKWELSSGVVTARGELDAANADQFAQYVARCARHCRWLVVDLAGLDFVGTAAFSALHRINVECSANGTTWVMTPSRAVARLLRICDPDGTLPITAWTGPTRPEQVRLLQLVPQPR